MCLDVYITAAATEQNNSDDFRGFSYGVTRRKKDTSSLLQVACEPRPQFPLRVFENRERVQKLCDNVRNMREVNISKFVIFVTESYGCGYLPYILLFMLSALRFAVINYEFWSLSSLRFDSLRRQRASCERRASILLLCFFIFFFLIFWLLLLFSKKLGRCQAFRRFRIHRTRRPFQSSLSRRTAVTLRFHLLLRFFLLFFSYPYIFNRYHVIPMFVIIYALETLL